MGGLIGLGGLDIVEQKGWGPKEGRELTRLCHLFTLKMDGAG